MSLDRALSLRVIRKSRFTKQNKKPQLIKKLVTHKLSQNEFDSKKNMPKREVTPKVNLWSGFGIFKLNKMFHSMEHRSSLHNWPPLPLLAQRRCFGSGLFFLQVEHSFQDLGVLLRNLRPERGNESPEILERNNILFSSRTYQKRLTKKIRELMCKCH
jgi:hypothetical protein